MAFRNIPPNGFPAIPDIEDLEGVEKDVSTLKTTTAGLTEDVSELRSGLNNLGTVVLLVHEEMPVAASWTAYQNITIDVNAYRYFGLRLSASNSPNTGTPLCIFSRSEFLASNAYAPMAVLYNTTNIEDNYNVLVSYNEDVATPLFYYRGSNVTDKLYLTIVGIK